MPSDLPRPRRTCIHCTTPFLHDLTRRLDLQSQGGLQRRFRRLEDSTSLSCTRSAFGTGVFSRLITDSSPRNANMSLALPRNCGYLSYSSIELHGCEAESPDHSRKDSCMKVVFSRQEALEILARHASEKFQQSFAPSDVGLDSAPAGETRRGNISSAPAHLRARAAPSSASRARSARRRGCRP